MKIVFISVLLFFLFSTCDILPDNKYDQIAPVVSLAEVRVNELNTVYITFDRDMLSALPAVPAGFSLLIDGTNGSITGVQKVASATYSLSVAQAMSFPNSIILNYTNSGGVAAASGGKLASFTNQQVNTYPVAVLWNKLGSLTEVQNSEIGANLLPGSGTPQFATGQYGNGLYVPNNSWYTNLVYIPGDSIPMSDLTVELWYTRTESFVSNVPQLLLHGQNTGTVTNSLEAMVTAGHTAHNLVNGHIVMFVLKLGNVNANEVQAFHNFGSRTALETAFPLNTPVHLAFSKRNSDGKMYIYRNGISLSLNYIENGIFIVSDTTVLSNKSGNFPVQISVGGYYDNTIDRSAKGVIDNLKVYNVLKTVFSDRLTE